VKVGRTRKAANTKHYSCGARNKNENKESRSFRTISERFSLFTLESFFVPHKRRVARGGHGRAKRLLAYQLRVLQRKATLKCFLAAFVINPYPGRKGNLNTFRAETQRSGKRQNVQ
jgi:hypothetical protein